MTRYLLLLMVLCLSWLSISCQSDTPAQIPTKEPSSQLSVDVLGRNQSVSLDSEARAIASAVLTSPDGSVLFSIDAGTQVLDKDGQPLSSIWVKTAQAQPAAPQDARIIGSVYSIGPAGASFDRNLKITIGYDPAEIPENVRESEVYIAPYDESTGWGQYSYKKVEEDEDRVTAYVERFTSFAVLTPLKASSPQPTREPVTAADLASIPLEQSLSNGLPTLAEFGSSTCIPCKQMKPILEELAVEYAGKLNVVIVEVYEHRELAQQHGIMAIPTQIFFDSSGNKVKSHMGFYAKDDIIAQLKKMGIE